MGRRKTSRMMLIALSFLMLIGIAFHFMLWRTHDNDTANDIEALRKEFDLANREAMDESAEWRRRYDFEFERATKCARELDELKKSGGETAGTTLPAVSSIQKTDTEILKKENKNLLVRVESLKLELASEKRKCRKQHP